ncbi:hypothetical protein [Pannonibacter phragmitetus]|uniref:hypothetical protein n=1 Tax=Pannonibacter phragmitetus TaxID=121719 RepID=UPI000F015311|nr:hypothetical protein [Pannonibacter phragmitetus]
MASRFTALPLSSGESFILETDHGGKRWAIMLDGGQSKSEGPKKNKLYKAIRKHCPEITDRIDIAICTHRDHDHAGGFPAFIKTWLAEGNYIGEFWLPGGWAGAVEMALANPDRLVSMLHEGARVAAYRIGARERDIEPKTRESFREGTLRSIQSQMYDMCIEDSRSESPEEKPTFNRGLEDDRSADSSHKARAANSWGFTTDDWEAIRSDLETSAIHGEPLADRARAYEQLKSEMVVYETLFDDSSKRGHIVARRPFRDETSDLQLARSLFHSAIDTAETIREIASTAVMFDIPVRWFDFAEFQRGAIPSGGIGGFLQPLNAVELRRVAREADALSLFFKLALTEQNVASLVFQRCETNAEPGAIFLGDSRLAFGIERPETNFDKHLVQPTRPIVYTAPHHGSRNNDRAYDVLADWLPGLFETSIAVRNGGVWNQTLSEYLKVKNRRCAQCHQCHGGNWSQLVQINSTGADWTWPSDQGGKCGVPKRKN